jgi:hypothetical protein
MLLEQTEDEVFPTGTEVTFHVTTAPPPVRHSGFEDLSPGQVSWH